MKALRLMDWRTDPVVAEIEEPTAGPGQVVIRIGAAGACHSDLHLMREFEGSSRRRWGPPFTLGHENAGWVHSLGSGVTGFDVGQAVAVYGPWGCGACERCRLGIETYCENPTDAPVAMGGGLGADGGMAELMLIPAARHLVPLPEGLDPVAAAPLTDAGLTPYHAVRRSWEKLAPGATAVVIGVGGLGHLAIQILKATTAARVIALDTREDALQLASECGADSAVFSSVEAADQIRAETHGRGADVVIDCVGSSWTLELAAAATRVLGDLTIVGLAGGTLPVSFSSVRHEVSIQTTYWGSRPELIEVLDLGARGLLRPEITTFSLERAMDAYRAMESGDLKGRAVVVPS